MTCNSHIKAVEALKSLLDTHGTAFRDLGIEGYLTDAIGDGEHFIEQNLVQVYGTASGQSDASMKAWHEGMVL